MVKYCALTTTSSNIRTFMLPACKSMSENGFDVSFACGADKDFKKIIGEKFKYYPLDISRGLNLGNTIKNIYALYRLFKKEKFQMIEYGSENVSFCAAIAGWMAHVPIRIYDHWGARYVGLKGFLRYVCIWIERITSFFSTDIRQVSFKNMEMCIKQRLYSKSKVKVLGKGGTIGVDFTVFDVTKKNEWRKKIFDLYTLPEDTFIFGFVGRIQKDKGINELLSAFKAVLKKHSNCYLMLVGAVDDANPVNKRLMNWAENCENVLFVGYTLDTPIYMSAFDVLVHPTYREGFGMVLQEAAAVKTPIITTDIIGPGEFITNKKTGILVSSKDAKELCKAMEKYYSIKEMRFEYAESCYNYTMKYFEQSKMVKRIVEDRMNLLRKLPSAK